MVHLIDKDVLSIWAVLRRMDFWTPCILILLGFFLFFGVVFHLFLAQPKITFYHWYCCSSVFLPHICSISISRSLYLETFCSFQGGDMSMSRQVLVFFLSFVTISSLPALISLPVCIGMTRSAAASSFSVTVDGWCSYYLSLTWTLPWRYAAVLLCLCSSIPPLSNIQTL